MAQARAQRRPGTPAGRIEAGGVMDPLDALNAELERALGPKPRAGASLAPLPAQLDLDGTPHEIAPQTERLRLFEPAPTQLPGQTHIDTDSSEP
jgi:hypothetical protein